MKCFCSVWIDILETVAKSYIGVMRWKSCSELLIVFLWAFIKLAAACVCWTRVGQWVTVAGCGSELWAFACFYVCPDEAEGSALQPHEGADA